MCRRTTSGRCFWDGHDMLSLDHPQELAFSFGGFVSRYFFLTIYSSMQQLMQHIITQLAISIIEIPCFFGFLPIQFSEKSAANEKIRNLKPWNLGEVHNFRWNFYEWFGVPYKKPFLRSGSPCLNTIFHIRVHPKNRSCWYFCLEITLATWLATWNVHHLRRINATALNGLASRECPPQCCGVLDALGRTFALFHAANCTARILRSWRFPWRKAQRFLLV